MTPLLISGLGNVVPTKMISKRCVRLVEPLNHGIDHIEQSRFFQDAKLASTELLVDNLGIDLTGIQLTGLEGMVLFLCARQKLLHVGKARKAGERPDVLHFSQ